VGVAVEEAFTDTGAADAEEDTDRVETRLGAEEAEGEWESELHADSVAGTVSTGVRVLRAPEAVAAMEMVGAALLAMAVPVMLREPLELPQAEEEPELLRCAELLAALLREPAALPVTPDLVGDTLEDREPVAETELLTERLREGEPLEDGDTVEVGEAESPAEDVEEPDTLGLTLRERVPLELPLELAAPELLTLMLTEPEALLAAEALRGALREAALEAE
jgi:hypothetical protein